ncbi:MAG: putative enoyl-CoA hydratase [Pseudomonadota bacterium]
MSEVNYTSPTERVETWLDQTTLHIRFNNVAKHNALSVDMWEAVPILLTQAESDSRVRLVVFSGAGEKAFVSGADISQFEDMRAAKEAVTRYEHMAETALPRWLASRAIALGAASMWPSVATCALQPAMLCSLCLQPN